MHNFADMKDAIKNISDITLIAIHDSLQDQFISKKTYDTIEGLPDNPLDPTYRARRAELLKKDPSVVIDVMRDELERRGIDIQ